MTEYCDELQNNTNNKRAWIYSILFFLALGENYTIVTIFNIVMSRLHITIIDGQTLLYIIFGLLYLSCLQEIINNLQRKRARDVFWLSVIMIIGVIVFWVSPQSHSNQVMIKPMEILLFYLPIYAMSRSVLDYKQILDKLIVYASISFLFLMYVLLFLQSTELQQNGYENHMTVCYQLGLCTLIFMDYFFFGEHTRIKKILSLICGVVGTVFVLWVGSRGTVVVLAVYFVYAFLVKMSNAKLIGKVFFVILIVLFVMFREQIITSLFMLFGIDPIESRTIAWLFGSNSELGMSGRDVIYVDAWNAILQKPFLGWGIGSDYLAVGRNYVHNLILEWLLDFGVVLGSIFTLGYVFKFIKALRDNETSRIASIITIYVTCFLMFSFSYLLLGAFWAGLGIIMSATSTRKKRIIFKYGG